MNIIMGARGGKKNDPHFHSRITGRGVYADLIKSRFRKVCKQHGLNTGGNIKLETKRFIKPVLSGQQHTLF